MEQLIISLIAGAAGGNGIAKILKNLDLGPLGNSIAGIIGGGLGQQILGALLGGGGAAAGRARRTHETARRTGRSRGAAA